MKIEITSHAVIRFIERHAPTMDYDAAQAHLLAKAPSGARLRQRTRRGHEQWRIDSPDCVLVVKQDRGDCRIVVTVLPDAEGAIDEHLARMMVESAFAEETRIAPPLSVPMPAKPMVVAPKPLVLPAQAPVPKPVAIPVPTALPDTFRRESWATLRSRLNEAEQNVIGLTARLARATAHGIHANAERQALRNALRRLLGDLGERAKAGDAGAAQCLAEIHTAIPVTTEWRVHPGKKETPVDVPPPASEG